MEQEKIKRTERGISYTFPIGDYNAGDKFESIRNWRFKGLEKTMGQARIKAQLNGCKLKPAKVSKKVSRSIEIDHNPRQIKPYLLTPIKITSYANYVACQVFSRPSYDLDVNR